MRYPCTTSPTGGRRAGVIGKDLAAVERIWLILTVLYKTVKATYKTVKARIRQGQILALTPR